MAESFDLIVVGAGPAGSAAALAALHADASLRVLVLDKAPAGRDKCCGDGIAPHVFDVLDRIGAPQAHHGWAPLHQLELAREESSVTGRHARPVWVIPRRVFDARLLASAISAGATFVQHRVKTAVTTRSLVSIDGTYQAPVVVAADGATSTLRAASGAAHVRRRAFAIRGYAPTPPLHQGKQVIRFGDRRQPAYAWSFDRGDGWSNVGYGELLSADGVQQKLNGAQYRHQLERLLPGAGAEAVDWKGHHLPLSERRWAQPDGRILLVGDAAGLINPLTGEGIYYAVATGQRAGIIAAASARGAHSNPGAQHRRAVRAQLGVHLRHTWAAAHATSRPGLVDVAIRASHTPEVFDDLVELGLGEGHLTARMVKGLLRASLPGTSVATTR